MRRAPLLLLAPIAVALVGACEAPVELPIGAGVPEAPREPLPLVIRRDQPQLLPFWVRQQRLAALLDVPDDDPVFDVLRANRLLLGDYDHASGVAPDLQWTPSKMSLWARAVLPVCAHPNLKTRHPILAIDLPRAAWGRDATVDEVEGMRADLDAAGLVDGPARDRALCVAVLSSLEAVTQ